MTEKKMQVKDYAALYTRIHPDRMKWLREKMAESDQSMRVVLETMILYCTGKPGFRLEKRVPKTMRRLRESQRQRKLRVRNQIKKLG